MPGPRYAVEMYFEPRAASAAEMIAGQRVGPDSSVVGSCFDARGTTFISLSGHRLASEQGGRGTRGTECGLNPNEMTGTRRAGSSSVDERAAGERAKHSGNALPARGGRAG